MHYDVFNGDADGIIALLQLRLAEPKPSQLITGIKRDINLLTQVASVDDVTSVTVLDISLQKNLTSLVQLLERSIPVFYCDHHQSGDIPASPYLDTLINLDSEICTSLLINQKLKGQYQTWAIAAAFGDNMVKGAQRLAEKSQLQPEQIDFLSELGVLINYNGYGADLSDLHFLPVDLFRLLLKYPNPFDLQIDKQSPFYQLQAGYHKDKAHLDNITASYVDEVCEVFILPCQPWARRISGVFGNELANRDPNKAFAVLTLNKEESLNRDLTSNKETALNLDQRDYTVSVRAPLNNRVGADEICGQFITGGGRRAAAGINQLAQEDVDKFISVLSQRYLD
ncbi:DHH family phosphoesterase [Vibrio sp. S17_S38]|uniref:DHH family phosphoesterase n=1 Tax=Vibrio sp. S17_S38 TaxID=2720229 RepID=UPI0016818CA4|nr:DHH family phosphoesterase [Vibrio sp. S17_S38]MBD1573257.1 DHH family phosphoesterase [Vibrio sp. S17_S38]